MGPSSPQPEDTVTIESPEPVKKYTKQEMGRLRRQFISKEYGTVTACGHKFHPVNQPTTNCDDCWEAFFRVHDGVVKGVLSIITSFGEKEVVKARGEKFVRQFRKFALKVKEQAASIAA
jgi:hypothetical protein